MPCAIAMPKLGMTMQEGTVVEWHVAVGAPVTKGQILLSIESEKAEIEIEAPATGVLRHIYVEQGATVPCGTPLAALTESAAQGNSTAKLGALSDGISESLVATATGIAVALVILFPYNMLRGVAERIAGRLEGLAAAAIRPASAREPAEVDAGR